MIVVLCWVYTFYHPYSRFNKINEPEPLTEQHVILAALPFKIPRESCHIIRLLVMYQQLPLQDKQGFPSTLMIFPYTYVPCSKH